MASGPLIGLMLAAMAATVGHGKGDVLYIGWGTVSCARWLETPAFEQDGHAWIDGFWSGLNIARIHSSKRSDVGNSTDGPGIWGEVKKLCQQAPSAQLIFMVNRIYDDFDRTGR